MARVEGVFSSSGVPLTVDLALAEALNALWKHFFVHRDLSRDALFGAVRDLGELWGTIRVLPSSLYSEEAVRFSADHGVSTYDSLYIASARTMGLPLLTGDRKLWKAAQTMADIRLLVD